ncbi:unnamed protein product [Paramecium primaurelia]|uniref:Uncharacterized protein n=1 Tax=Paramecium primaurelia TaxID=5886 RepID=A0A8S1NUI5_PARPR|nr:unnamed protein product [Paramecium primaurelia]
MMANYRTIKIKWKKYQQENQIDSLLKLLLYFMIIDPIIVENCKWGATQYILVHQNQATKGNVEFTYFTICKSLNNKLVIDYFNVDSFIDAPLNKCNDLLWQHDVDEFYIGTKKEYYVINVSPNGALAYSTKINPNGNCSDIITIYRQCDQISYFAEFVTPTAWNAHIELPISMFTQYIYQFLQSKQDEGQLNSLYELQSYQFITCLLPQTRQIHLIDSVKYKLNHQIYIIQYYVKFISRPYLFVNSQISTTFQKFLI